MKKKWFVFAVIVFGVVLTVMLLVTVGIPLWHLLVLQPSPDPEHIPAATTITTSATTTTTTTTSTTEEASNAFCFTGKVLEVNDGMALMDCYDKEKFDTVWVNYANTPAVTPQIGEVYSVVYEDLVMPSLPPRIFAVEMTLLYAEPLEK